MSRLMPIQAEFNCRTARRRAFAGLLAWILIPSPTLAQQQYQARNGQEGWATNGLGAQNQARVAASAAQIAEVLRKDAGLMVELKRWVAKEATDRGQIVEDADLADSAIFIRLENDVEFRSVATRLVQRYGYLMPQLNPDSEVAKERDILIEERTKRLLRAEAEEEEEARQRRRERNLDRASRDDRDEESQSQRRRVEQTSRRDAPQAPDPFELPRDERFSPSQQERLNERLQTAGGSVAGVGVEAGIQRAAMGTDWLRGLPDPGGIPGVPMPEERLAEAIGRESPGEMRGYTNGDPRGSTFEPSERRREGANRDRFRQPHERDQVPLLVRRPNPYADIPSLYDLYLQAPQRPAKLERFGLDVFRNSSMSPDLLPVDLPVGPDYVVGPGDGLAIDMWGGVTHRLMRTVDNEGRVALPEVGPVMVSGRTMGEVQQTLQQVLRSQFRDISADVSLARLRTVRVYVVGDVEFPGAYEVSSLSTPLAALFQAGGPTEQGSARTVRHFQGKQLVQEVDVYDLLLRGIRGDVKQLRDGDTVMVPPIGPQVKVEGMVRRPALYEIRGETPLDEVLELAGGILPTATLRNIQVQRLEAHEKRTMISVDLPEAGDSEAIAKQLQSFRVRDGDEIRIFPIAQHNQQAVYLLGHALRPGRYSYSDGMRVSDLISSYKDLLPEPAPKYAEIIRLNAPDFHPSVESFDLGAALANPEAAPVLKPMDTVRVFSRFDFEEPPMVWVGGEVYRPGTYQTSGQIHLRDAVHLSGGITPDAMLENAQVFRNLPGGEMKIFSVNLGEALAGNPIDNVLLQPRDRILVHRSLAKVDPPTVYIKGEVAKPGRYPLTNNMRISDLIGAAGGLKRSAFTENADLTRYLAEGDKQTTGEHHEISIAAALSGDTSSNLILRDGDTLSIRQIPGWQDIGASIVVEGEVQHPGTYGISPGEKLSSVLRRAGGFLPTAYARGAVYERVEVRKFQEKTKEDLVRRAEQEGANVKVSLSENAQEHAALQQAALVQKERVLGALRQAPVTGRMVVRLSGDLNQFAGSPDDIEVRAGDRIAIPKNPNVVIVTGQVYNPNALTFRSRKSADWYLERAGGPTELAEKKDIFIVRANGEVVSGNNGSWWGGGVLSTKVEPGDTIVVPEKAIGGSTFWRNFVAIAQVASSAAIGYAVATR